MMERLARVGPVGVVWDYYFRTPQPGDVRFVAGVNALEAAGVPVVLAAPGYRDDGAPDLSATIRAGLGDRLRHGSIVARDMARRPGEFVIAGRRPDAVIMPSVVLTTLAGLLHPETHLEIDWNGKDRTLELLYRIGSGAYLRERDRIGLTKVFKAGRREYGLAEDDQAACHTIELARPEHWQRLTVPYETLLTCSGEELRAIARDKLIVVGDLRRRRPFFAADRHRVRYGGSIVGDVPGCYLLADAIAGMLDRRYMRSAFPLPAGMFVIVLLSASVGCLVPLP